jgi:hypothetical protein
MDETGDNVTGEPAMDEQTNNARGEPAPDPEPKRNAGWVQRGSDSRRNIDGRPPLAWADCIDPAPCAGRLMLVRVPRQDFARRLTGVYAPWAVNLPADFEIVASRVDTERDVVVLIIRSQSFDRVAKHAPLPEFKPEAPPAYHTACDDRLRQLFVPGGQMAFRLGHIRGFCVLNLPSSKFEIVACRVDSRRRGILYTLHSPSFSPVAKDTPIPEIEARFDGLAMARGAGWDRDSAGP